MTDHDDPELEAFFEAARARPVTASDPFLRRIALDADQALSAQRPSRPKARSRWFAVMGGWPVGAGLASAASLGLMIGMTVPEAATRFDGFGVLSTIGVLDALDPGYGTELFEEG